MRRGIGSIELFLGSVVSVLWTVVGGRWSVSVVDGLGRGPGLWLVVCCLRRLVSRFLVSGSGSPAGSDVSVVLSALTRDGHPVVRHMPGHLRGQQERGCLEPESMLVSDTARMHVLEPGLPAS